MKCLIFFVFVTVFISLSTQNAIREPEKKSNKMEASIFRRNPKNNRLNLRKRIPPGGINPIGINTGYPDYSNGYLNGNPNGYLNGNPNGYLNGNPNGYLNGNPNGYLNGNPNGYLNGNQNGYLNGNPNGYLNGNQNGYLNGNPNGYLGGGGYDSDEDCYGIYAYLNPDCFSDEYDDDK